MRFLSGATVMKVHQVMIEEFGGDAAVRDVGLLESAIAMPAAQAYGQYLHEGIAAQAAAYLFHLCQNHPFVDGKKRTALACAELFLRLNGHQLVLSEAELYDLTMAVAAGRMSKEGLIERFRAAVRSLADESPGER